ncbi:MAG: sugar phosphate isomerase/epimerase [Acidobacteria bacterium]|nr:sugar phosphate isomerase/epimerase [Acidobacteriota bacterium]
MIEPSNTSRRSFLAGVTGLAVSFGARASAPRSKLRLGGPIFTKSDDPAELARAHRALGYSAAYVPQVSLKEPEKIKAIEKAFAAENVVIAEVGAWKNMLEADAGKRLVNLGYVTERLALAEAIGARNCVNIAGSFNPKQWDGPDPRNLSNEFFDATVENCRKVIDAVKPTRTKFTIEMMGWSLPDGADAYLKLFKAIARSGFGVHVDICNIINSPDRFYRSTEIINEVFRKLGRWICSCHAKDLQGKNVHFIETVPGRGGIDYRAYLANITALPFEAPLMLEHLSSPAEYDEGRQHILGLAKEMKIDLA